MRLPLHNNALNVFPTSLFAGTVLAACRVLIVFILENLIPNTVIGFRLSAGVDRYL